MHTTPLQTSTAAVNEFLTALLAWPEVLGLVVAGIAVWVVYQRTQSSADPTGSVSVMTATGSASISISGSYWVAALVGAAAFVTWPIPMEFPLFGIALVALVGIAWWLEREEAM